MIATLSVLSVLVGVEPVLWLAAAVPAIAMATTVTLLLAYRPAPAPVRAWQERERHLDTRPPKWRPAHRASSARPAAGRHEPATFGGRARQVDRVGENTVQIDSAAILGGRE